MNDPHCIPAMTAFSPVSRLAGRGGSGFLVSGGGARSCICQWVCISESVPQTTFNGGNRMSLWDEQIHELVKDRLLHWFGSLASRRPRMFLTHGEDRARFPLARRIRERHHLDARLPDLGEIIEI